MRVWRAAETVMERRWGRWERQSDNRGVTRVGS